MYDRDKLIDRILELDGKISGQAERIKALEEALATTNNLLTEANSYLDSDFYKERISLNDDLLTPIK